jgi:hypothetical protein
VQDDWDEITRGGRHTRNNRGNASEKDGEHFVGSTLFLRVEIIAKKYKREKAGEKLHWEDAILLLIKEEHDREGEMIAWGGHLLGERDNEKTVTP